MEVVVLVVLGIALWCAVSVTFAYVVGRAFSAGRAAEVKHEAAGAVDDARRNS